ncbi:aminotransferase class III-fold pyridoxal phosphate-dependent enzyme [Streptomyces sp. NPDC049040]|uniref:aminotransferase class III-fold pyridoxal phosphate-dependent enzyme n=1 Tax=Streptomyces sp. NPDC049040 TaxID=3365593 RepID=UPI0037204D95
MRQSLSTPCLDAVAGAHGSLLEDPDGRTIPDFHGNSVHQVGYGPALVEATRREFDTLPFSPRRCTNLPSIELARRLAGLCPGDLDKVLLAPSGAGAVGTALQPARSATGRHKAVSM